MKLLEVCLSFCYITDVSKRVPFDYDFRALKFCFSSEPKQCLSTAIVSKLLELVQIFQEGKLAEFSSEKSEGAANLTSLPFNGSNYFFGKLLQIFESRRHEDYLVEIIDQTLRIGSSDAKHATTDLPLQTLEHVVSPVFLRNWMKLLTLRHVSSGFAFHLAKVDILSCTKESTVCYFVSVLEEMKRKGIEVIHPRDKERFDIFFNHLNHFCDHPNVSVTSLKLLATSSISNEVLREVLDQVFYKERE